MSEKGIELEYSNNLKELLDSLDVRLQQNFLEWDDVEAMIAEIIEEAALMGYEAGYSDGLDLLTLEQLQDLQAAGD